MRSAPFVLPGRPIPGAQFMLGNRSAYRTVFVFSLDLGKNHALTDGLSDAIEPVFDASGKYLFFLASTDAGPTNQWFAQSNADMRVILALSGRLAQGRRLAAGPRKR